MPCFSDFASDFIRVWPHILLGDALRYVLAAGIGAVVLFWWAPAWLRRRRIQTRQPGRADFVREIASSMLTVLIFSLNGFAIYIGIQLGVMQLYSDVDLYGWFWLVASLLLILLTHDSYFYWLHRAMHHRWVYRRVHRLHHRSVTPTPFTAYAMHPFEAMLQAAFLPLFLLLLPLHGAVVAIFLTVMIVRNVMGHGGFEVHPAGMARSRLFGWLTTTTHHDMHHSHPTGNFGLYFTWWDRLLGTEHADYRDRFDEVTGRSPAQRRCTTPVAGTIAVLGLLAVLAMPKPAHAEMASGRWVTPGASAIVVLERCAEAVLCGRIVWLWNAVDDSGAPRRDLRNPDPARRQQPLLGLQILSGFRAAGDGAWRDGRIYNPEDGNTYSARLTLRTPEVLAVEGCLLVLCREQIWRRAGDLAQALSEAPLAADK